MFTNLCPQTAEPAIRKRDAFLREGFLSRPTSETTIAVVTSLVMNKCSTSPKEAIALRAEGRAILDRLLSRNIQAIDVTSPTVADMDALFRDPAITDLCIIGEGALGNVYVAKGTLDPSCGTDYDWISVSNATDHLKTGSIYQRMCSVVSYSNVVWGTFAAEDLTKIWVSERPNFTPTEIHDDPARELMRAYEGEITLTHQSMWELAEKLRTRE